MTVFSPRQLLVLLVLAVAGCQASPSPSTPTPADTEAEIRANLALLGPEDQRLAEQQKTCPLLEGVRLGEMGRPYKIIVKGVPTFVCCEGCVRAAQEDPDLALSKVRELQQARARELTSRDP
jgi:hypothetical protein